MKKLKLDIELLQVDTFDTHPNGVSARGTVRGNQFTDLCQPAATQYVNCYSGQATCDTCNSCQNSTAVGDCFCTECVTCWNCAYA